MSQTLSDGFCNTFHIGKVARKPTRKRLDKLSSAANKYPAVPEQIEIVERITQAYAIIYGGPKTNMNRADTIQRVQAMADDIERDLELLKKKTESKEVTFKRSKVETKDDKKRKDELLQTIETILGEIDTMFTPVKGRPNVAYLEGDAAELSRFSLVADAQTLKLDVKAAVVTDKVKQDFETKIVELRGELVKSGTYADSVRALVPKYDMLVDTARKMVVSLAKTMGDKANKSPLALKAEALAAALHPEMDLLNRVGIEQLATELNEEISSVGDIQAYSKTASDTVDLKAQIETDLEVFDKKVNARLQALRLVCEPIDSPLYREQNIALVTIRATIANQTSAGVNANGLADGVLLQINAPIAEAEQATLALQTRVQELHDKIEPALKTIRRTKDFAVFTLDWKQIDGLQASIARLMPTGPLNGQTLANLAAAEPLVNALLKTAADIAKDTPAIAGFDLKLAGIKKSLKDAADKKDPLTKYYAADLKKMQEDFDKFEKALPKTKAKVASDSLDKQVKAFEDKRKTADELGTYIKDDIEPAQQEAWDIYTDAQLAGYEPKTPNAQQIALDAFHDELKKQPPDKSKLAKMLTTLNLAFKDIKTIDDLLEKTAESHEDEKKKAKEKKEKDRAIKTPLLDRLEGLKRRHEAAKEEVEETKGDMNPIKRIEALLADAKVQIKAVEEAKATSIMNRIEQQLGLVLSNPKGEAASKRQELPALYTSYTRIRQAASKNLIAIGEMVETYAESGDDEVKKKAAELRRRIASYRKRFAVGHGELRHLITLLADDNQPDQARRDAREKALAAISELQRGLQAHKLSKYMAKSKIRTATAVPRRLLAGMDRLYFTILTSVE